jgi:tetratricopeptide (TPR) repeat protein
VLTGTPRHATLTIMSLATRSIATRHPRALIVVAGGLLAAVAVAVFAFYRTSPRPHGPEPFFSGLGDHTWKVGTNSPLAQRYFDQGLAFLYGFNYTEAARSFEAAKDADPNCAMVYWGIAIANGDAINDPVADEPLAKTAVEALARAHELAPTARPVEQDLIAALSTRYADPPPTDPRPLDRAYAEAMREVAKAYPDDGDVGALTGQALMLLHRNGSWTQEGEAQPSTIEAIKLLQGVIAKHPRHPYALHLLVHIVEASPTPQLGDVAADRLRDMAPGLGHLTHMPTHIDIRRGRWQEAVVASEKAVAADRAYRQLAENPGLYCRILMAHDNHMLAYAAAMQGQSQKATQAARDMLADLPADFIAENKSKLDALFTMPYELHLRFGQWDEMLAEPEPSADFPITVAFWHFARGTAFTAKKELASAKQEQMLLLAAFRPIPEGAVFRKNYAEPVMRIGESVLAGEVLYREGKVDQAVARLRDAVRAEDALLYTEPPEWLLPARHALGATLMDAHRYAEAEAVYREDLARRPENGWSLFGLARALRMQKKTTEAKAVDARLKTAWQHADVKLTASCLCLPSKD